MGLLLKNGNIIEPKEEKKQEGVDIYITDGKIKFISSSISNDDVGDSELQIIDLEDGWVIPSLMDAHSHLGIHELDTGIEGDDTNETFSSINAHLRAIDAFSYYDSAVEDAIRSGVTSVCVTPGSLNPIGGQMAVLKMSGFIVDKNLVSPYCGLKAALGENTKKPRQIPGRARTRMGNVALIREAFYKARDYEEKKKKDRVELDLKSEALLKVLNREVPLRLHAHRADDIATGIRIAKEFNISLVIEHGTSAHLIADYVAENSVPIVAGPYLSTRKKPELLDRGWKNLPALFEAGLRVALTVDHPVVPIDSLWENAMMAYREGVSYWNVLRSITYNPALICGVSDRLGRVAVGYDADLTVWDGDPLEWNSKIKWVFQDGRVVFSN